MSQITQNLVLRFRAVGGNVLTELNSYSAGFGNLGRSIMQNTQESSKLNQQWKAMGTTIRYAIAGGAVFGLARMVSQLSQVNVQLGQMQALSGIGGSGRAFDNTQMGNLLNGLLNTSDQTVTALSDVNDAAINFLSTVQDVNPNQLPDMIAQIGLAARLSQTDIENMTQAATTMQVAFGRPVNPKTIGQFSRMFTQLVGKTPGGTHAGTTIAQGMPGLASMFQMSPGVNVPLNVRQAQMMALTQGVLSTGMPASTGLRGLTYLIQSIAQPTGKAISALAGIGITRDYVHQHGVFAATMKLLHTIQPVNKRQANRLGAIDDSTLDSTNALPGIPAQEMARLRTLIPRIHGIRAAIILSSRLQQQGKTQSLDQALHDYIAVQNPNSAQAKQVEAAQNNFKASANMQQAAIDMHNAGIQITQAFQPFFNLVSGGIIGTAGTMAHHPEATKWVARAGIGFMAALGVAKYTGVASKIPGLKWLNAGESALGSKFVATNAVEAAMRNSTTLGGSPQNPMYVTVVGQLFGGAASGPTTTPGAPGFLSKFFRSTAGKIGTGAAAGSALKYVTTFGKFGGIAGLVTLPLTTKWLAGQVAEKGRTVPQAPGHPELDYWAKQNSAMQSGGMSFYQQPDDVTGNVLDRYAQHKLSTRTAEKLLEQLKDPSRFPELAKAQKFFPRAFGVESMHRGMFHGHLDMNLLIDLKDQNGKITTRKVHVPVDLWSGGRTPQSRGKKNVRVK